MHKEVIGNGVAGYSLMPVQHHGGQLHAIVHLHLQAGLQLSLLFLFIDAEFDVLVYDGQFIFFQCAHSLHKGRFKTRSNKGRIWHLLLIV